MLWSEQETVEVGQVYTFDQVNRTKPEPSWEIATRWLFVWLHTFIPVLYLQNIELTALRTCS